MEILQLQQSVMGALGDSGVCGCNFDPTKNKSNQAPLTFNANNPGSAKIRLDSIYSTCVSDNPGGPILRANDSPSHFSALKVTDIFLTNIEPTGSAGEYRGELQIHFDNSSPDMVIARRPARIPLNLATEVSSNQASITGCSSNGSAGGGVNSQCVTKSRTASNCSVSSNQVTCQCDGNEQVNACFGIRKVTTTTQYGVCSMGGGSQCVVTGVNNESGWVVVKKVPLTNTTVDLLPGTIQDNKCILSASNAAASGTSISAALICCP